MRVTNNNAHILTFPKKITIENYIINKYMRTMGKYKTTHRIWGGGCVGKRTKNNSMKMRNKKEKKMTNM